MPALIGKGVGGQLEVDGEWVTIKRKGVLAKATHGLAGEKRIPISSIMAVQWKAPGMSNGYIQFTVPGGVESKKGLLQATEDENTVMFTSRHKDEFGAIRDYIEARIASRSSGGSAPSGESAIDKLKKLGELRDAGVVSEAEFELKKRELLDEI